MENNFIVSKAAKEATKDCSQDFSCLSNTGDCMGKVVFCLNRTLHGILCSSDESCAYRYESEDRVFCICPIRKEIYTKYKV
jgi:hypothetical protein